ncbi:MAG: aminotransferase class IV, partial [Pseudomonadota bacterium]
DIGMERSAIETALHDRVAATGLKDSYCAMGASRGAPMFPGSRDPRECANHFYAWAVPYVYVIKPEVAEKGATLWIPEDVRRIPQDSVNPRAKNYHWGDFTEALFQAKEKGFDTGAVMDHDGNVTEGPGFNVFALKGDRVVTSDHGVLHGITRKTVLEICAEHGLKTETRPLPLEELMEADEIFLSTSGGGVTPVRRVRDRVFSNDAAGQKTLALLDTYRAWLMEDRFRTPIAYA